MKAIFARIPTARRFHRGYGTLTKIKKDPEITIYIKGFLSKIEKQEKTDYWLASHHKLVFKQQWNKNAEHYNWDCGNLKIPPPLVSGVNALYAVYQNSKIIRLNPWTFASSIAIDTTLLAGMVMYQYLIVEENTHIMAPKLALHLIELSKKYEKVRVICHSLGCKLLLNSIEYITNEKHKPTVVHLCAPTFNETEYEDLLDRVAKQKTYIYYTNRDSILSIALQVTKNKDPVGAYGLCKKYNNVKAIDVTNHFDDFWLIHTNYHKVFHQFVENETVKPIMIEAPKNIANVTNVANE